MSQTIDDDTDVDVKIDFPQAGEVVNSQHYTIRLGALNTTKAEVSIDGNDWQACRFAVGYWWFDWSGYLPGKHQLKGRVTTPDGQTVISPTRTFFVRLDEGDPSK